MIHIGQKEFIQSLYSQSLNFFKKCDFFSIYKLKINEYIEKANISINVICFNVIFYWIFFKEIATKSYQKQIIFLQYLKNLHFNDLFLLFVSFTFYYNKFLIFEIIKFFIFVDFRRFWFKCQHCQYFKCIFHGKKIQNSKLRKILHKNIQIINTNILNIIIIFLTI